MSSRWYPVYQRNNPQLRIFLPNFWMKLVKPERPNYRSNIVTFHVPIAMTKHDIKNYLEKIYKVAVVKVNTRIELGEIKKNQCGHLRKADDIKIAYVSLPRYESFEYPNLFDQEKKESEKKREDDTMEEGKAVLKNYVAECKQNRPMLPGWFRY